VRELIRHILKENRIQQSLKQVIENGNIFDAADLVGGIPTLKKIFKDDPEMSSLFEKLTGTITFYYYLSEGSYMMKNMKFPLKYEIIGRKSNVHKTNYWPEINVFYDENKLTPEENDTFKSMIKYSIDESNFSDFDAKKFGNYKLFNVNYFTVKELNGENIDLIGGWYDFSNREVNEIHNKLYGGDQNLNESTVPTQVRRRNEYFDIFFKGKRKNINYCSFKHPDHLMNYLLELTLEDLYHAWFYETVTYEEWEESIVYIENYIKEKYYNETVALWKNKCEGRRLFESEQNISKKINIASNIIENEFSDVVKSIDVVEYFNTPTIIVKVETDDSAANVTIWLTEEMINTVSEITSGKVKLDYWFTGNKESEILLRVKKINGNNNLNESSVKEKSLINIIENEGLYDFIEMTGIDFNEVRSLLKHVDNPKEMLKQYIREFVLEKGGVSGENYGSLFGLEMPLSNTKYVEDILVHDEDSIAVEMWEYHLDEYGHREQKDQYLTTINNLTNDELLTIVAWMMETLKGNYWD